MFLMRLMFLVLLYCVKGSIVSFLLLSALVQRVGCPGDGGIEPSINNNSLEHVPPPPCPATKNPCGNVTIVCTEGSDSTIPWVTFVVSIPLVFTPGFLRIWKLSRESLGLRHMFFVWSLILSLGDYILWWFYTSSCRPVHGQFPILLTSIYGVVVHVLLIFFVTFKLPTSVSGMRLLSAAFTAGICSIAGGILLSSSSATIDLLELLGWISLGLGVLSHLFRMKSMDYDNYDPLLLSFSLIGAVNGLLWLGHPDLCVARQYKVASYLVAALRATEAYYWLSSRIGNRIERMEGPEVAPAAPGAVVNIPMVQMGAGQNGN